MNTQIYFCNIHITRIGTAFTAGTVYTSWNTFNMKTLLATYAWSRWNIWNIRLQHICIATATMQHSDKTLATYVWSRWNILNRYLQHTCIAIATYEHPILLLQHLYHAHRDYLHLRVPSPTHETLSTWKALLATYVSSKWNIWNICLQHMCIATATYATFR
jgi:hypothetical protein